MDIISFNEAATANGRIEKFISNPDSNSGIVTVPKTIGAGESVTVPAGRVAVLPNVQVDGTLNIEGEVFIPTGATFSKVVETEGNQTITDVKTFTSSPIVPTPTAGDNSTKVATTAFVKATSEASGFGVGQTWQNVTSSRSLGVTYTNTTGKPIVVSAKTNVSTGSLQLNVDGVEVFYNGIAGSDYSFPVSVAGIVPDGSTYNVISSVYLLAKWNELR